MSHSHITKDNNAALAAEPLRVWVWRFLLYFSALMLPIASAVTDLEGPRFDVSSLRRVLIEQWRYPPANISTLVDSQATEAAILDALDKLQASSSPGDSLLVYFSGHGTSAADTSLGAQLHLPDGSGAIAAYDFDPGAWATDTRVDADSHSDGLLIGRYDLRPRFQAMDKDRTLLVMFDACFTGNTARSIDSDYTPRAKRFLSLNNASRSRSADGSTSVNCDACAQTIQTEYPYNQLKMN